MASNFVEFQDFVEQHDGACGDGYEKESFEDRAQRFTCKTCGAVFTLSPEAADAYAGLRERDRPTKGDA